MKLTQTGKYAGTLELEGWETLALVVQGERIGTLVLASAVTRDENGEISPGAHWSLDVKAPEGERVVDAFPWVKRHQLEEDGRTRRWFGQGKGRMAQLNEGEAIGMVTVMLPPTEFDPEENR